MKGAVWFFAGAATASYLAFRGKKLYRESLPEPLRRRIEDHLADSAADFGRFSASFKVAMAEREAELTRQLNQGEQQ